MTDLPCLLATGGYDHSVRLWSTSDPNSSKVLQHQDSVSALRRLFARLRLKLAIARRL